MLGLSTTSTQKWPTKSLLFSWGRRAAANRRCRACWPGWRRSPTAECVIGDQVVNDVPPSDRDIAMVLFQSYALYPHMSVSRQYGL